MDFPAPGNYVLRLLATDGMLTANSDMPITVTDLYHGNEAPVVSAGLPMAAATSVATGLQGAIRDDGLPAGNPVTALWSKISGPGTVTFGNTAITNTTATFNTEGIYVLQLRGDDGQLSRHSGSSLAQYSMQLMPADTGCRRRKAWG